MQFWQPVQMLPSTTSTPLDKGTCIGITIFTLPGFDMG
jgi:hypothetical protein